MTELEKIEPLIADKCINIGFELFEARFFLAGSRSILRIFIDSPNGVTIADCEKVSSILSGLLDEENFLNGHSYTLEVSSLGIDRALKTERDFQRISGREVSININETLHGKSNFKGIIKSCVNNIVTLDCAGETVEVPLGLILSGKEVIKFK